MKNLSLAFSVACAFGLAGVGSAQTLLGDDFEFHADTTPIVGNSFRSGSVSTTWQTYSTGASASTFNYSYDYSNGGNSSGKMTRTTNDTTQTSWFWGSLNAGNGISTPAGTEVVASVDMFQSANTAANGAAFGIDAFSQNGGAFLGSVLLFGGDPNVDPSGHTAFGASSSQNGYYDYLDANGNPRTYALGTWNNLKMVLDYTATDVTASYYLNGTQLYTSYDGVTLTPLTYTSTVGGIGDISVSDFDLASYAFGPAGGPLANNASGTSMYFDNYNVSVSQAVPEPMSLIGLGIVGLAALRRRKSA